MLINPDRRTPIWFGVPESYGVHDLKPVRTSWLHSGHGYMVDNKMIRLQTLYRLCYMRTWRR